MRHRKSGRKLKRTASHRKALLAALSTSLLRHRRVRTTTAKAREAQRVVERLITKAKRALARESNGQAKDIHGRREVARVIKDRAVVKSLFEEIAPKVAERSGGYTRLVKLGRRRGDAAEVALLELVDFSGAAAAAPKKEKTAKEAGKEK
jgi:large subunit ribosomal protein L17